MIGALGLYSLAKSGQLPLSVSFWVPPEVRWAISASGTAKGMNLITYGPRLAWSTPRYIHLGQ